MPATDDPAQPRLTAVELLEDMAPHRVAGWLAERATAAAGTPTSLYVVDIAGTLLRRVSGAAELPDEIPIAQVVGPELPSPHLAEVVGRLAADGVHATPLVLRGRAIALLLSAGQPRVDLEPLTREATGAIDLADRFSDVLEAARRRRRTTPAAELQEMLLPPRIAIVEGAELAGTVIPAYDVGGDWFDYAEGSESTWLTFADGVGRGAEAMAIAGLALGALRSVRRTGGSIEDAAAAMHDAVAGLPAPRDPFVTAVIATFEPATRRVRWASFGHPPPFLVTAGGRSSLCDGACAPPLGILDDAPECVPHEVVLEDGDRLVLYSDGVIERRQDGGRLGFEGLERATTGATHPSAASLATSILRTVIEASPEPVRDDATLLVLRAGALREHGS
jgi:serine phosphatase RsbU (regulator of sigma subunit)